MMTMGSNRICVWCDMPIKTAAVPVPQLFATSGARPDDYRHPEDDPDCEYQAARLDALQARRPRRG